MRRIDAPHLRPARTVSPAYCQWVEQHCLDALKREADLWPKPGLVTPVDSGSHRDMDHSCFMRSITALQGYFAAIVRAGSRMAPYSELQQIALSAEARMLAATGGVNTHRGAIFNLGLLAAAAGFRQKHFPDSGPHCGHIVAQVWGKAILASHQPTPSSHGEIIRARFGVSGAREQAAQGFPQVYETGWPGLENLLAQGVGERLALVGTLLVLMETVPDTNLLWRGGWEGLSSVQQAAREFNQQGGIGQTDWQPTLLALHARMVDSHLSPGGSADLLAASWLVYQLEAA